MEPRLTDAKITDGEIVVDCVWVMKECEELATILIECKSKYPEIAVSASQIALTNIGVSLHTDTTLAGRPTFVEFPEFPEPWEIFSAIPGRYDVRVTLERAKNPEIVS